MAYDLFVRQEAETDIKEGFDYYESCRDNLGYDFLLCIEESFEKIQRNPSGFKTVYRNIRRTFVRRFPFGIYFVISDNNVSILAVAHVRRNPSHWQKRT